MSMPWWWRIAVLIVGGMLALFSFFGKQVDSNLITDLLTDLDQWIINNIAYPSLFALGISLILSLWLIPEIAFLVLNHLRAPKYWEWHGMQETLAKNERLTFFRLLDQAYLKWRNGKIISGEINQLIDAAEYPNGLPVAMDDNFRNFEFTKDLSEDSKKLMAFALEIYPGDRTQNSQILSGSDEEFHSARMGLAKFWDVTGRKIFDFHELRISQIRSQLPTHASEIKILTYLEWALAKRLHSNGPGKQWMFKLYKAANEKRIIA